MNGFLMICPMMKALNQEDEMHRNMALGVGVGHGEEAHQQETTQMPFTHADLIPWRKQAV